MKTEKLIFIGTSGWYYPHWKGPFYHTDTKQKDFLAYYIKYFHTVEINNSFYQLPAQTTFKLWRQTVPDNFVFAVKASRFITHMKKLKDPHKTTPNFFERVDTLAEKLGPILFQLPPRWKGNPDRLKSFLKALPKKYKYSFEFRDPTWFNEDIYQLLAKYNAAFCIYEFDRRLSPKKVTADFVYIRLHGPHGPYQGQYNQKVLSKWAQDILRWVREKKKVFCYFDNDQAGYAAKDAIKLQEMIFKHNS
jgi:uncharacterized protein YecE (DUF72 family)